MTWGVYSPNKIHEKMCWLHDLECEPLWSYRGGDMWEFYDKDLVIMFTMKFC
jgi:hypothetical protein